MITYSTKIQEMIKSGYQVLANKHETLEEMDAFLKYLSKLKSR